MAHLVSSRERQRGNRIVDHGAVDDVGQSAFEAPQGFFVALAGSTFALVVSLARWFAADLSDGHDVQRVVELAIADAREPVPLHVA